MKSKFRLTNISHKVKYTTIFVGIALMNPFFQNVIVAESASTKGIVNSVGYDNTLPVPVHVTEEFIDTISEQASQVAKDNNLYASVMIAQAILESGHGSSTLSSPPSHNLFGIKGNYRGNSVNMSTSEYIGGQWSFPSEEFRSYPNYKAAFLNNAQVLRNGNSWNPNYYSGAWTENTNSYLDATEWLAGRYATDPNYADKLNRIIQRFDLTKYDLSNNVAASKTANDLTTSSNKKRTIARDGSTHTVEAGDTLFNIAKRYQMTVSELQNINNLSSEKIVKGQKLFVSGTSISSTRTSDNGVHTVENGDTLYNIANRYQMTVTELQQLNNLNSEKITIGQDLKVDRTLQNQPVNSSNSSHTVDKNDTLYNIAKRYSMTVLELQELNGLSSEKIKIGQTLQVVSESSNMHTVSSGDTIFNIAQRYGLTVDELKTKNNLITDVIEIGQELSY